MFYFKRIVHHLSAIEQGLGNLQTITNDKLVHLVKITENGGAAHTPSLVVQNDQPEAIPEQYRCRFKPVVPIADYAAQPAPITYESLKQWRESETYERTHAFFRGYPEKTLQIAIGGEILYHLIRSIKPKHVLEIGTYYAGASEAMARALHENGSGMLHTADPFGVERCPIIIGQWPAALREHVAFYPNYSMDFLLMVEEKQLQPELVFIDGNHDFEYAYFDLMTSAKLLRPGGLIVLDNIEQPGPYWAAIQFLKENPDWIDITQATAEFTPDAPFENMRIFLDKKRNFMTGTPFLILQAPSYIVLRDKPVATGQYRSPLKQLQGLEVSLHEPATAGTLHYQLFLRAFANGPENNQELTLGSIPVETGATHIKHQLPAAMNTAISKMGIEYYHTVEVVLYWQPKTAGAPLKLTKSPEAF